MRRLSLVVTVPSVDGRPEICLLGDATEFRSAHDPGALVCLSMRWSRLRLVELMISEEHFSWAVKHDSGSFSSTFGMMLQFDLELEVICRRLSAFPCAGLNSLCECGTSVSECRLFGPAVMIDVRELKEFCFELSEGVRTEFLLVEKNLLIVSLKACSSEDSRLFWRDCDCSPCMPLLLHLINPIKYLLNRMLDRV